MNTTMSISMPVDLAERLQRRIPKRERSAFIQRCVELALDRFDEHERDTGQCVPWPTSGEGPAAPATSPGETTTPPVVAGPSPGAVR